MMTGAYPATRQVAGSPAPTDRPPEIVSARQASNRSVLKDPIYNWACRPLWKVRSVADFLCLEPCQVMQQIESGELLWAFDIGLSGRMTEPRILSRCAVEKKFGVVDSVGSTRNLSLPEVINLILPARDLRSTELERLLSCSQQHVYALKFKIARKPAAKDGPHAFTVFTRTSVAEFLSSRRIGAAKNDFPSQPSSNRTRKIRVTAAHCSPSGEPGPNFRPSGALGASTPCSAKIGRWPK